MPEMRSSRVVRWNDLTAVDLRQRADAGDLVILPIGSIEQHGPHLPVDTDVYLAAAIAEEVARRSDGVTVAPSLSFGQSAAHVPLGATVTLGADTLLAVLRDVVGSIHAAGFGDVLLLNGHNGNKPFLQIIVSEFATKHMISVAAATYYDLVAPTFTARRRGPVGSDAHAGELETALLLYLSPERVRLRDAVASPMRPLTDFDARDLVVSGPAMIGNSLPARFPTGTAGDPTVADAELGRELFEAAVSEVRQLITSYRRVAASAIPRTRPRRRTARSRTS